VTNWFSILFSEAPGEPSIRRVVFALSFVFGAALCFLGVWTDIPAAVERIAITIIGAAFGVMGIGRFAEAMDRRDK